MTTNEWISHSVGTLRTWQFTFCDFACVVLYGPDARRANHSYAWAHWKSGGIHRGGHARTDLLAYCEREGITLPMPPADWWPEPVEEPAKPDTTTQPPTLRDRLLNLADRMFYSDHTATFYAGELRDLARELDGGDQ